MQTPQKRPRVMSSREEELIARMRAAGIDVTPATAGPDDPLPDLIDFGGVTLSDVVIEMRREGW